MDHRDGENRVTGHSQFYFVEGIYDEKKTDKQKQNNNIKKQAKQKKTKTLYCFNKHNYLLICWPKHIVIVSRPDSISGLPYETLDEVIFISTDCSILPRILIRAYKSLFFKKKLVNLYVCNIFHVFRCVPEISAIIH